MMRRHFEKRESEIPATPSHGDSQHQQPRHRRLRRKSWSGVLGWRNKSNKHNTNTGDNQDSHNTISSSYSNNDNNTIGNISIQPQQQHNVLTNTTTGISTSTDNSTEPLSPPSTINSVATTIQAQDHHLPQYIHLSAFHPPSSPPPSALDDHYHEHQQQEKQKQDVVKSNKVKVSFFENQCEKQWE